MKGVCWLALCLLSLQVSAVKKHDFKTCAQSGFCRRNRALADRATAHAKEWSSPYSLTNPSFEGGAFKAGLHNALFPQAAFSFELRFQLDGVVRLLVDEVNGLRQRYNQAATWTLVQEPVLETSMAGYQLTMGKDKTTVTYDAGQQQVVIDHKPLKLVFFKNGVPHITLNGQGLFNMEHFRLKSIGDKEEPAPEGLVLQTEASTAPYNATADFPHFLDSNEDGMWDESFAGHRDSKPKGPESLSLDIQFEGYEHVFGIPQHSGPLSLRTTRGGKDAFEDPYRLFNLDVFEYEHDSPMSIYGSIPFMQAHRAGSTVGVFWLSAAETWIDIEKPATDAALLKKHKRPKTRSSSARDLDSGMKATSTRTHWISESGVLDLFIFLGTSAHSETTGPQLLFKQFTDLVGRTAMPQYFAIGHHQCRWNYLSQEDVLTVSAKFDEFDMPMDVIWLDIEYATEHKYFDWDRNNFADPEKMQEGLAAHGRKLVAIIDPHIKRVDDFYVYKEAKELDLLAKKADGSEYEGWCWTGSSSWVDFFNPASWAWWSGLFKYDKFKGSTPNLFIWNDMNEPAVFNGPEITMPKDNIHHGGWEHRDLHNLNGVLYHNSTARALIERDAVPKRPFVLSRAFFAGSQRFGPVWTGDNLGTWDHLAVSSPMVLANSIGGMAWNGADVGGFFGNPSEELLVRWYQIGAFYPFFRAHGHIDTKRREPYLCPEPTRSLLRDALRLRYSLLPTWYTAFWDSARLGVPIVTPHYVAYPQDEDAITIDDQFFLGHDRSLLLKPVTSEGAKEVSVYLSDSEPFYDYFSGQLYKGPGRTAIPVTLETIPLLQRGGSIITRRDLVRRSAPLMWRDPITLVIALDSNGEAQGTLYTDDGETYDFEKGDYLWRSFEFKPTSKGKTATYALHSSDISGRPDNDWTRKSQPIVIRTIVVLGLPSEPKCIRDAASEIGLPFAWAAATTSTFKTTTHSSNLTIEDAELPLTKDWTLTFGSEACATAATTSRPLSSLQSDLCPPNHFRCENSGHKPACLLLSRVNDGICDPSCCDGSDEFDGKVECRNRCAEVGSLFRKERDESLRKHRVGAKQRDVYIKTGKQEKDRLEKELTQLQISLTTLESTSARLQAVLKDTEAQSAEEITRKKQSRLYRRLEEHQAAIRDLRQSRAGLRDDLDTLKRILDDLQKGYNPNYQDMAVKGAVKGFEEWQKEHGVIAADPSEEDGDEASPVPAGAEAVADKWSDAQLQELEGEDLLALIESSEISASQYESVVNLFKLEDYLPPSIRSRYRAVAQNLVDVLQKIGVINVPQASTAKDERPDVLHAKEAANKASAELSKARKSIDDIKAKLGKDWGPEWEWKKLEGTCIDKDTGEYTYELCFFESGKQKSNKGHMSTTLGRFSSWHADAAPGSQEYYSRQVYDGGQKCWNGPERSVIVDITCSVKNELLSIIEPEKCEYHYKVTSPAACWPLDEERLKDEL